MKTDTRMKLTNYTHSEIVELQTEGNRAKSIFHEAVRVREPDEWAEYLVSRVDELSIRCWAASVIWWAHFRPASSGPLCDLVDACGPTANLPDAALNAALDSIGLPPPNSGRARQYQRKGYLSKLDGVRDEIVSLDRAGETHTQIARRYNVTRQAITKLIRRSSGSRGKQIATRP